MRLIDEQSVEDIAVGASVLGAGGGGDPYIGKLMAIDAIIEHGPVKLLSPDEVKDDELVIPTAMMGAPTVIIEKVPRGDEALEAFKFLERRFGKKALATMPIEAGGINSTIPIAVAANLGIPIVDCDGMGRAFPEVQMVIPHVYGIKATPMVMVDEKGNVVVLDNTVDNLWTEKIARAVTVVMGGSAVIALFAMTGRQIREATIHGSLTLAENIGKILREHTKNPIKAMLEYVGGFELFKGKIVDVERRTVAGFARGETRLEGIDEYSGHTLVVKFQNENLVAIKDGRIMASVPDLITILDSETGKPITTEGLRYGYRATVIGIPCSNKWRTPEALEVVGPRYFGYDIDYVPIEERVREVGRDTA